MPLTREFKETVKVSRLELGSGAVAMRYEPRR